MLPILLLLLFAFGLGVQYNGTCSSLANSSDLEVTEYIVQASIKSSWSYSNYSFVYSRDYVNDSLPLQMWVEPIVTEDETLALALKGFWMSGTECGGIGSVHEAWRCLRALRELHLVDCILEGTIPSQLFGDDAGALRVLNLSSNNLGDLIGFPSANATLEVLSVAGSENLNVLSNEILHLTRLVHLDVSGTKLNSLPSVLLEMPNLKKLYAHNIMAPMVVPDQIFMAPALDTLYLYNSDIQRPWPTALGERLKDIRLHRNQFSGPLLTEAWSGLGNLHTISLGGGATSEANRVQQTGGEGIDTWLMALPSSVTHIAIQNLNVSGELNDGVWQNLPQLKVFSATNNRLSGTVDAAIGALAGLSVLDLSYNNFEGVVPALHASALLDHCAFFDDQPLAYVDPVTAQDVERNDSSCWHALPWPSYAPVQTAKCFQASQHLPFDVEGEPRASGCNASLSFTSAPTSLAPTSTPSAAPTAATTTSTATTATSTTTSTTSTTTASSNAVAAQTTGAGLYLLLAIVGVTLLLVCYLVAFLVHRVARRVHRRGRGGGGGGGGGLRRSAAASTTFGGGGGDDGALDGAALAASDARRHSSRRQSAHYRRSRHLSLKPAAAPTTTATLPVASPLSAQYGVVPSRAASSSASSSQPSTAVYDILVPRTASTVSSVPSHMYGVAPKPPPGYDATVGGDDHRSSYDRVQMGTATSNVYDDADVPL